MASPAGPCEWCGGPQHWAIIRGDMYVSCKGGCIPLEGLGITPPLDAKELIRPEETPKVELSEGEGVRPLEGGDARTTVKKRESLELAGPGREFLDTLWEGGCDGS